MGKCVACIVALIWSGCRGLVKRAIQTRPVRKTSAPQDPPAGAESTAPNGVHGLCKVEEVRAEASGYINTKQLEWTNKPPNLTVMDPRTCSRCGVVARLGRIMSFSSNSWLHKLLQRQGLSYDWARWKLEWSGAKIRCKILNQNKAYRDPRRRTSSRTKL